MKVFLFVFMPILKTLSFINKLDIIVAGVWLAVLGQYHIIFAGVIMLFLSAIALGFVFAPSMIFLAPAVALMQKGKTVASIIVGTPGNLYTSVVITAWCIYVLRYFTKYANDATLLPLLIMSYGVAIAPMEFMSTKDESFASNLSTFFAEMGFITIAVLKFITNISYIQCTIVFASFMLICSAIQLTFFVFLQKEYAQLSTEAKAAFDNEGSEEL